MIFLRISFDLNLVSDHFREYEKPLAVGAVYRSNVLRVLRRGLLRKGLVGRLGRWETRKRAKDVGKGKERKEVPRPFSPPIVHRALTIFFNYYWNIQRDPCRGEREGRKHN